MMNIEVRADGARITGYVNVTEKKSRPVITPRGKVIEEIEPRAFAEAINRAGNITVTVDHDKSHIYASTDDGTVTLKEDAIGLHADVLIKDKDLIELAKKGKIRGWSFGMYNVKDSMEERADDLPIRHIKALDLDHLTLVVKKSPIYSATYLEMHRPILFNELVLSDKLFEHCAEIDEAARNRMELIVRSLAEQNGVTEQLKADNQMEWVRQMNACKAQSEEIVKAELIYD